MSAASALQRGREMAEALMVDACTIGTEANAVDPVTLKNSTTRTNQYAGKCKLSLRSAAISDREANGQAYSDQSLVLAIPVGSSTTVKVNAIAVITAVDPATGDPAMVGRRFRIAGLASGSQSTAARYSVTTL